MTPPSQMSTPISNIPVSKEQPKIDEDPEVSALLKEMQPAPTPIPTPTLTQNATSAQIPPQQSVSNPSLHSTPIHQRPHSSPTIVQNKKYLDYDILYKTLYGVIIAYIVFYPNVNIIYEKFPILDKFKNYEYASRAILFGAVVYIIMWKFYSN